MKNFSEVCSCTWNPAVDPDGSQLTKLQNEIVLVSPQTDLMDRKVPNNRKIEAFLAIQKAPQNRYIFWTGNSFGYGMWPTEDHPDFSDVDVMTDNLWLGITYTGKERHDPRESVHSLGINTNFWYLWRMSRNITPGRHHTVLFIDPLTCDICNIRDEREGGNLIEHFLTPHWGKSVFEWVVVGGPEKNRNCEKEWVDNLVDLCVRAEVPIFMRDSLIPVVGEECMRREVPDALRGDHKKEDK